MFPRLLAKPVRAEFDEPCVTSDGGALLLKAADERLGLTDLLAVCVGDRRDPARVRHETVDLVRQRVFGLALGYEDANDVGRLAEDPMQRMLLGRDPVTGQELASQPTLSRFENGTTRAGLLRMGLAMAHAVLDRAKERRGRKPTRLVTIDVDPMDDPTHGAQQLSFFNGHYDCWCYLPLLAFVSFDGEPEQWLVASVLRPGNAPPAQGAEGLLRRVIALVRERFPGAAVRVRLDGGFASGRMLDFLEGEKVEYVVGLPRNARLEKATKGLMREARRRDERRGHPKPLFAAIDYRARRWRRRRRVIAKAEIVHAEGKDPKENPRYVVTNLPWRAREVYDFYCGRGDVENRLKELKALGMDRTSCTSFWANQLRVLLAAAAYVLLQELRAAARRTSLARAQIATLRLALLKIGARVVSSVRRLVVHMTGHHPWRVPWLRVATALGAV
jgi:hypothetical protein